METKITTVSLAAKEDKYYADKTLYQWNYGQILRIVDADLPMAVEVGFSTTEKSGNSDVRVGSTNNGVTTVAIPNKLFEEERSTDYSIYAFVYVTDENSGTTVHEIVIPVKARAKQGDPSEDPSIDPSVFEDAINAVNASAERAETAEKSAKESADKAKEYAESAGKSKGDVEKARDSAISAIGIEKESALRGIEIKTVESLQKIQSQTEESQNSIKQSIENATEKKSELDGAVGKATEAKKDLEKGVQSAKNTKVMLDGSIQYAGEAKTQLDSSISSAGEKQLALDATVEQANAVDASLKEQIGSAEQIQANVEQIAKNKADISSLNEDLEEVKDKKITKFYASNQGETHLADSDNGKIMDMMLYGMSEQKQYRGKNLLKIRDAVQKTRGVTVTAKDGVVALKGTATETGWAILDVDSFVLDGTYILSSNVTDPGVKLANKSYKAVLEQNKSKTLENEEVSKVCFVVTSGKTYDVSNILVQIEKGSEATSYEPYVGGQPSPSPDYPQEIKNVVNPTIKLSNEDGTQFETVTLPYTLNAIPVSSGGNVIIDGQQYIADRVVEKDGVFGIERNIREIHTNTKTMNNSEEHPGWNNVEGISDVTYYNEQPVGTSRILTFISNFTQSTLCQNNIKPTNIVFLRRDIIGYSQSELIAKAIDVDMYIRLQDAIFEPLPGDIQAKLRTLVTNYPVTNISVTSDQLDGYTVFNYPISMKNGWDYVKKQLNDNRDYIYNMDTKTQDIDTQAAEAYVNSEYAVALTELEV